MQLGKLLRPVWALMLCYPAVANVFEGAEWLRDPLFQGVEPIDIYHKEKAPKPALSGPQNVHTYFRREITLDGQPASATLWITGDDYYKFYINGVFVAQGPESSYPFAHPYYRLDVTAFLHEGPNALASHVYYQGLVNRVGYSGDNRSGFAAALEVRYPSGRTARFTTDAAWRCRTSAAYPTGDTAGYATQFLENIDMREIPVGWRETGFNDSTWAVPLTQWQDHRFVEQITPPLDIRRVEPLKTEKRGAGHYFYDFGSEIVGCARIRINGKAGHTIEVRHGEELNPDRSVRYEMRAKCVYLEKPILRNGENLIEFYDYKAFRYIELLNCPAEPELWVDARHHPFDWEASSLSASDTLLTDIWTLCKNGVRWGSQGGFLDCPTREKGQYLGDALITSHAQLLLTADPTLTQKALVDFHYSQRICPGMMAVAPSSFMQEIAEYSLQWPLMLLNYYRYTGDRSFVDAMVCAAFDGLYGYFEKYENEHGLLTGVDEKWVLVDWPDNLRNGYDYEYAKTRENAVLNAFYYESLWAAAELMRAVDLDSGKYTAKAARVKKSYFERLFNTKTGLFVDAPGSKHSSLHANALPLAFGMVPETHVPRILDFIREKRLSCGVYMASFVIQAAFRAGDYELGYELITSKDERSWHEMLKHGATTCMEAWGPDQKWNTSWLHPWSSSPVYLISEEVMGLTPATPGWRRVRFRPRISSKLDDIALRIPTPQGKISASYAKSTGYTLVLPPGVEADVDAPGEAHVEVTHDSGHATSALSEKQRATLAGYDWVGWVSGKRAAWVSIEEQRLRVIEGDAVIYDVPCATAEKGAGFQLGSEQTPLGWHAVDEKIGAGAPWGQVFRSRVATNERWRPGGDTTEDLVLTRILWLTGLEPGKNKGGAVDSKARFIYIHGTNGEHLIGTPSSHGCIRLRNDDVIVVFDLLPEGTPVLITG